MILELVPERERGFVVLPDLRFRPRVTHSLSDAERNGTPEQKAKDWDVLELFYKMDSVEGPKLHASKLGRSAGVISGEDRLWLHCSSSSGPL